MNGNLNAMKDEHEAWKGVVKHWPDDINHTKHQKLLDHIRNWGEKLAKLRRNQPDEVVMNAEAKAEARVIE